MKYMAYCRAMLPPKEVLTTFKDMVTFAQFYLCHKTGKLMKDPIWDKYTSEEIMVEYFTYQMVEDRDFRSKFELKLGTTESDIEDFFQFTERMERVEKEKTAELTKEAALLPDVVTFSPEE